MSIFITTFYGIVIHDEAKSESQKTASENQKMRNFL